MELRDFGRLIKDGELRIKAHNDQKVKVRSVTFYSSVRFKFVLCKSVILRNANNGNPIIHKIQ